MFFGKKWKLNIVDLILLLTINSFFFNSANKTFKKIALRPNIPLSKFEGRDIMKIIISALEFVIPMILNVYI